MGIGSTLLEPEISIVLFLTGFFTSIFIPKFAVFRTTWKISDFISNEIRNTEHLKIKLNCFEIFIFHSVVALMLGSLASFAIRVLCNYNL